MKGELEQEEEKLEKEFREVIEISDVERARSGDEIKLDLKNVRCQLAEISAYLKGTRLNEIDRALRMSDRTRELEERKRKEKGLRDKLISVEKKIEELEANKENCEADIASENEADWRYKRWELYTYWMRANRKHKIIGPIMPPDNLLKQYFSADASHLEQV
jgi:septal ring factor EnvC (AmiA/AmiB activator)